MTAEPSRVADAVRLAVGTLTVLPTRPPSRVNRQVAGWSMALAPVVGWLLGLAGGLWLWLLGWGGTWGWSVPAVLPGEPGGQERSWWFEPSAGPHLAAALTVGLLALLTRGMHLDGLADTADGLGSRRPAHEALAVMRRGDVGPFGVVTLVLVLLVQVLALADLAELGLAVPSLVLALTASRAVLPLLCRRGVRPARGDGLGATVVGSVAPWQLALSVAVALLSLALGGAGSHLADATAVARAAVAVALALGAAALVAARAARRLGGLTGDVLGAGVEVAFTTALVVLAVLS